METCQEEMLVLIKRCPMNTGLGKLKVCVVCIALYPLRLLMLPVVYPCGRHLIFILCVVDEFLNLLYV